MKARMQRTRRGGANGRPRAAGVQGSIIAEGEAPQKPAGTRGAGQGRAGGPACNAGRRAQPPGGSREPAGRGLTSPQAAAQPRLPARRRRRMPPSPHAARAATHVGVRWVVNAAQTVQSGRPRRRLLQHVTCVLCGRTWRGELPAAQPLPRRGGGAAPGAPADPWAAAGRGALGWTRRQRPRPGCDDRCAGAQQRWLA